MTRTKLQIKSIEFDKNKKGVFGIKSAILWGITSDNVQTPILYLSRPKCISVEDYNRIIDNIKVSISIDVNKWQ